MAVIFILSAQPSLPDFLPSLLDTLQDVAGHFAEYAVLALLLHWALEGSGASRPALVTLLFVLLYALSDEFHQSFVPGRTPDPLDIVTDLAGAAAALLAFNLLRSRRARRLLP
jgi:VanZ family protein